MSEEQEAELRYEAGMYQSLYEKAKARIEALEAEVASFWISSVNLPSQSVEVLALLSNGQEVPAMLYGKTWRGSSESGDSEDELHDVVAWKRKP